MAKPTLASLTAQIAALEAALADRDQQMAHLQHRLRHDYVEVEEYRRVQRILRTTQQFAAKYKERSGAGATPSARRQAMDAAREAAMAGGTTVAVQL